MNSRDEAVMFVICGIMIDLERATREKELLKAARCIDNYRKVIATVPGFLKRFEQDQIETLKNFDELTSKK